VSLFGLLKADALRAAHLSRGERHELSRIGVVRTLVSPRMAPVLLYRLAYWCGKHRLGVMGRLLSMTNFVVFGLEIGLECEIGPGLFFPHTSGTVIGAARIGSNATIYQNVTLGAKDLDFGYRPDRRPTVGDDVLIGSGAKILGALQVGDGATAAANSVVLRSVPEGALVGGVPAEVIRREQSRLRETV
jgi:serine O-acetyltransferase